MQPARLRRVAAVFLTSLLVATTAVTALPIVRPLLSGDLETVSRSITLSLDGQRMVRLPIAASHVVLRWSGAADAAISIALGRSPDRLSEEIPIAADPDAAPEADEAYSDVIWADGARWARITTDRHIDQLRIVAMDTDESRGIDESGVVSAAVNQPAVITRAGWGANEGYAMNSGGYMRFPPSFNPVQKLIVHHTAGRNNDPNPASTIRAIYYDHAVLRGYGDIDYNFLVDAQGRVYEGRRAWVDAPLSNPTGEDFAGNVVRGAHAKHFNDATVGIALLGNFTSVMPTTAARTALVNLLAWKAERLGVDPKGASTYVNPVDGTTKFLSNISGHRNVNLTACPGELFYNSFPTLRQDVANRIAATTGSGVDSTPPRVLSLQTMGTNPSGAHTQRFGLIFSEPISGLSIADFSLGGTSSGWTVGSVTGKASTYTVTAVANEAGAGPADGTLMLTLGAAKVLDRAGLAGPTTAASRTINFAEESNPPTAVVYTVPTSGAPVGTSYSVTVNFDEPVTGFGTSDIVLGGSSQAATPWTRELIYGQGAHYEFTLDRVAPADGTLTIQINGSGVQDLAGNAGDGSNVVTRIIDHSAPTTTTPKASLRSGTTLGDGTMRVALTWAGTDIGPSGIQSYDIQRKRDSGAYETVGSATSASFNWAVTPGHTYVFRIRA